MLDQGFMKKKQQENERHRNQQIVMLGKANLLQLFNVYTKPKLGCILICIIIHLEILNKEHMQTSNRKHQSKAYWICINGFSRYFLPFLHK